MKRLFGKPQNLDYPANSSFNPSNSFVRRGCRNDGVYGAFLSNVINEPIFLYCDELLALASFVERNRVWFEEHDLANREWYAHEVASCMIIVMLRNRHDPDNQVVLSLFTENRFAWYGTLVMAQAVEKLPKGSQNVQVYLRSRWEEYGERRKYKLISC